MNNASIGTRLTELEQEEDVLGEAAAREDRICLLEAELVVDHVFNGSNFLAVPNNSLLYNELYRLAYEDGCADRCTSCRQKASYVNRVQNASGRYTSIPGTAQDAFLFFFLALLLGCLFAANWKWVSPRVKKWTGWIKIPHTITVLIAGGAFYLLGHFLNLSQFSNSFAWWLNVNPPELLFYALLPVLLFDAAMRVEWFYFRTSVVSIMIFAFVIVILNSVLTGVFMQYVVVHIAKIIGAPLQDWKLYHGLTMGAILGSTDPVAVISFMEENNAPVLLATIIEGESLFNDASAYILFQTFLMNAMETFPKDNVGEILLNIFYAGFVGLAVGLVCGTILVVIIKSLHEQKVLETNFTLVFAYLSFYLAQGVLNASGPVAVTTTGLLMASSGLASVSPRSVHDLLSFWDIIVFISNSIIFFYSGTLATSLITREFLLAADTSDDLSALGKASFTNNTSSFVGALLMGWPLIYLSQYLLRGLWILVFYPFMKFLGFKKRTPGTAIFLNLCALRGGINLIMVLIVAQTPNSEIPINVKFFLSLWTTGFVLMTLLINAPAIPALLKACGLVQDSLLHLKMFEKAKMALKEFTFDAIKKLQRDPSLISADMPKILEVVEEIFEGSDTKTSNTQSTRASMKSRHVTEVGVSSTRDKSHVYISKRNEEDGTSTYYFHDEDITNVNKGERALSINIQRRSYELTKTERKVLPRRCDHLAGYCHLVTSVRAAGINTLKSETAKISKPDSLPSLGEELVSQTSLENRGIISSRGIISDSWVELPETDRTGYTMEKFFKSFEDFKDQDDSIQINSPLANSPKAMSWDEAELRVKFLAGMKRHFRQQRTKGKITSSELMWLEDACDRASHDKASPLRMWQGLETKLWVASTKSRHKTFSKLKKTGLLYKYVYPLFVWWYFRGMKLGCTCALTFLDALRSVGKYSWVRAFEWLDKEVQKEIQMVEEFLYHLRLDEPDLVQGVQTYRATRYLGTMMIGFVEKLHQSGLLEEHDVEKLDEPIKRILRNQSIALPSLPTFNDTIVKSLAFCKHLPARDYEKFVLRSLKYKSLKRGQEIPQGVHIVLQGVVSSHRIYSESTKVMSLLGSGAILGLTEVMTKCEKSHADKYAYSSLVHLAFLSEKSIMRIKQISQDSAKELYRCCAASVLDAWLRHTLVYESPGILDLERSASKVEAHPPSSLSESQDFEEEESDLGTTVLRRLDRESINGSLPRRKTPSSSRKTATHGKRNLERDMQRVVEASSQDKRAELKRITMHLLNSLDFTDVVILHANDSITQQGHLVLLGGVIEEACQNVVGGSSVEVAEAAQKQYSDASVILYKTQKKFVAQAKSYLIAFHPSI